MAAPRAGIVSDQSATAATAFHRIELNPTDTIICTEIAISHDGPANNTDTPVRYNVERSTTVGTGTAATIVKLNDDTSSSLGTTGLVENSADGTLADTAHQFFVPIVSGIIWVARPGNEIDCIAAEFLGLKNMSALPSGRTAACHMVWQE